MTDQMLVPDVRATPWSEDATVIVDVPNLCHEIARDVNRLLKRNHARHGRTGAGPEAGPSHQGAGLSGRSEPQDRKLVRRRRDVIAQVADGFGAVDGRSGGSKEVRGRPLTGPFPAPEPGDIVLTTWLEPGLVQIVSTPLPAAGPWSGQSTG